LINLSPAAEASAERAGLEALDKGDTQGAIRLLRTATHMRHAPARAWYNLGVACQRASKYEDAAAAYKHAADMPDAGKEMREAAKGLELWLLANERRQVK
jgi:Flp pilus assembly protein TadD